MKFIFSGKAIALYLLILTIYTSIYHPVASWYVVIIDFIGIFYALHKAVKNTPKEKADEILRKNYITDDEFNRGISMSPIDTIYASNINYYKNFFNND